jgi:hypothetical protein
LELDQNNVRILKLFLAVTEVFWTSTKVFSSGKKFFRLDQNKSAGTEINLRLWEILLNWKGNTSDEAVNYFAARERFLPPSDCLPAGGDVRAMGTGRCRQKWGRGSMIGMRRAPRS